MLPDLNVDPDKVRRKVVWMLGADRAGVANEVARSDGTEAI